MHCDPIIFNDSTHSTKENQIELEINTEQSKKKCWSSAEDETKKETKLS